MKISEIFESIQGEGDWVGSPTLFIRMSGCNLNCEYCDTKYHTAGKEVSITELVAVINNSKLSPICWTGGEPTLQIADIRGVIRLVELKYHMLETNGTLRNYDTAVFDYIVVSPKDIATAEYWKSRYVTIKVVTDLQKINMDLIEYADYLMPLTTYNEEKDKEIKRRVWNYCVKHNVKYSPRLQVDLWGDAQCK